MRVRRAAVHLVSLPMRTPFVSARDTVATRDLSMVELDVDVDGVAITGWGECVALPEAGYTAEWRDGAVTVLVDELLGCVMGDPITVGDAAARMAHIPGNPMAKSAVEMALLDASLRASGRSLAAALGATRTRVPAGAALGVRASAPQTAAEAVELAQRGYRRVKLKVAPDHDVHVVEAVRAALRAAEVECAIQVDANESYRLNNPDHVRALDELDRLGLVLIEQPLARDDLDGHAHLARRLATPICLDESIDGLDALRRVIELRAADVVCIKPGVVGGYLTAVRLHDVARAAGLPVWCGGMLDSGYGRAANRALAALDGFTYVGDLSATDTYLLADVYAGDVDSADLDSGDLDDASVVDPDGTMAVPTTPGVAPAPTNLAAVTTSTVEVAR